MARYAPMSLILLPAVWITVVVLALTPMFWALGSDFPREAFTRSGSSLLTLGFAFAKDLPETVLSFVAATIGLGLVALLISYLPSIYAQFSRREVLVGQLDTRAGTPPDSAELLLRAAPHRLAPPARRPLGGVGPVVRRGRGVALVQRLAPLLPQPAPRALLAHRRRLRARHRGPAGVRRSTCPARTRPSCACAPGTSRCGTSPTSSTSPYDPNPQPDDPISIAREEFDEVFERLAAEGAPMVADRDQAWRDFAGWRVNYDQPLVMLCSLVNPPYAKWSSDRGITRYRPPDATGRLPPSTR